MNQKIDYKETTNDLLTRIDIHNKYGGRDIDQWMLEVLDLQPGMKILDVGCGGGKQLMSYHKYLNGDADITGGDVNDELLEQARFENIYYIEGVGLSPGDDVHNIASIQHLSGKGDIHFFDDDTFDLVSCCFAIYYASDIPYTISEIHRVLKPGGRLFTTGPMPENKKVFYDVIREASGKEIPPMPGSSRYSTQIYSAMTDTFSKVETVIFENPLTFKTAAPFIAYTRASLDEDRRLWTSLFSSKEEYEQLIQDITRVADGIVQKDGELVMTKVVGGFIGTK